MNDNNVMYAAPIVVLYAAAPCPPADSAPALTTTSADWYTPLTAERMREIIREELAAMEGRLKLRKRHRRR